MLDVWNKAVLYHFIHAIALFALRFTAQRIAARGGCFLQASWFSAGPVCAGTDEPVAWCCSPLGGLFFLAGWALADYRAKLSVAASSSGEADPPSRMRLTQTPLQS
jgi:uncharacterized membrane protein YgdD (TMEM256/DUF423 family)